MISTEHCFSLKSGFKKIVLTQNMVSVLNLDSQIYCLHQTFLYRVFGEHITWKSGVNKGGLQTQIWFLLKPENILLLPPLQQQIILIKCYLFPYFFHHLQKMVSLIWTYCFNFSFLNFITICRLCRFSFMNQNQRYLFFGSFV